VLPTKSTVVISKAFIVLVRHRENAGGVLTKPTLVCAKEMAANFLD